MHLAILFNQKPVPGFPQDGLLLVDIQVCHVNFELFVSFVCFVVGKKFIKSKRSDVVFDSPMHSILSVLVLAT